VLLKRIQNPAHSKTRDRGSNTSIPGWYQCDWFHDDAWNFNVSSKSFYFSYSPKTSDTLHYGEEKLKSLSEFVEILLGWRNTMRGMNCGGQSIALWMDWLFLPQFLYCLGSITVVQLY
jgi:hypothetical protein